MTDGIQAIRKHLKEVDNVPLLVSLFTDSTSDTIKEMVNVFKENGEVVLCVGSSCRLQNNTIFQTSDLAVAVATLPGDKRQIPLDIGDLISRFPSYNSRRRRRRRKSDDCPINGSSENRRGNSGDDNDNGNDDGNYNIESEDRGSHPPCLCRDDLLLHYRLIGLGTAPLLQLPPTLAFSTTYGSKDNNNNGSYPNNDNNNDNNRNNKSSNNKSSNNNNDNGNNKLSEIASIQNNQRHLRLSALLEGVHMGRIYLVNSLQVSAFLAVSCLSMALWPLVACALPLSIPPSLSPPLALLFLFIYIPLLSFAILFGPGPDGVMKATPRKKFKIKNIQENNDNDNDNDVDDKYSKISEMEILLHKQQKQRKIKDEKRFFSYLLTRCLFVAFSLFATGWLACAGIFKDRNKILTGLDATSYSK